MVNQFFMKLFCTRDINVVRECQLMFNFKLPSEQLTERTEKFIYRYEVLFPIVLILRVMCLICVNSCPAGRVFLFCVFVSLYRLR